MDSRMVSKLESSGLETKLRGAEAKRGIYWLTDLRSPE